MKKYLAKRATVLKKIPPIPEKLLLTTIVVCFFGIFLTVSLHRYWQYAAWYYDFGIFYSAISAVAQGREPIIDHFIFTDQNILSDHFHPLIFLASPLVALFKTGETLLIFQAAFVALSGIFVYLTAKELLKNKTESFSILILYFSFIGLHNALITEFHEITLLPLPLMMFFYGMVKKQRWWYGIGLLGVLLTKESTFIIPAWFGLVMALKNTGRWRVVGAATTIFSFVYGAALLYLVFPAISGSGYHYLNETMTNQQNSPLFNDLKIATVSKTFLSFGFLPLLAPETLAPVFFNWWSRFSSVATTRHDLGMHYNAEIAPTLILGTIYGWQRLKILLGRMAEKVGKSLKKNYFGYLSVVLALASLFFNVYILKSPALLFFNRAFYAHTSNLQFLDDLLQHVPDDGVIMAQTNIAAKLAYRKVYMLRDDYAKFSPDYIVIDTRDGQEPNNFLGVRNFDSLVRKLEKDPSYELYHSQGEQKIYKRRVLP